MEWTTLEIVWTVALAVAALLFVFTEIIVAVGGAFDLWDLVSHLLKSTKKD